MFRFNDRGAGYAALVLRVVLGTIFVVHGSGKVANLGATIEGMSAALGISSFTVFMVSMTELIGGLALILGLFTRLAAFAIASLMLGAVMLIHAPNGFFLKNHGYEYNLALLGMAASIMITGAGRYSIDEKFQGFQASALKRHSYLEREANKS